MQESNESSVTLADDREIIERLMHHAHGIGPDRLDPDTLRNAVTQNSGVEECFDNICDMYAANKKYGVPTLGTAAMTAVKNLIACVPQPKH